LEYLRYAVPKRSGWVLDAKRSDSPGVWIEPFRGDSQKTPQWLKSQNSVEETAQNSSEDYTLPPLRGYFRIDKICYQHKNRAGRGGQ
jgi:hypothetical protein